MEPMWSLDEIVRAAEALDPEKAYTLKDGAFIRNCATEIISAITINGEVRLLRLDDEGRYGGAYVRVSRPEQRSKDAEDEEGHPHRERDGFSESDQIIRCAMWFVERGLAFRVVSDCGLSGYLPTNDERLIRGALRRRAQLYRRAFEAVLLDSPMEKLTDAERRGMQEYLDNACTFIESGMEVRGDLHELRSGRPHARLPFYYQRDQDGRAVPVPHGVEMAQRMIELYLETGSYHKTADILSREYPCLIQGGQATPMNWDLQKVRMQLRSPMLIGYQPQIAACEIEGFFEGVFANWSELVVNNLEQGKTEAHLERCKENIQKQISGIQERRMREEAATQGKAEQIVRAQGIDAGNSMYQVLVKNLKKAFADALYKQESDKGEELAQVEQRIRANIPREVDDNLPYRVRTWNKLTLTEKNRLLKELFHEIRIVGLPPDERLELIPRHPTKYPYPPVPVLATGKQKFRRRLVSPEAWLFVTRNLKAQQDWEERIEENVRTDDGGPEAIARRQEEESLAE